MADSKRVGEAALVFGLDTLERVDLENLPCLSSNVLKLALRAPSGHSLTTPGRERGRGGVRTRRLSLWGECGGLQLFDSRGELSGMPNSHRVGVVRGHEALKEGKLSGALHPAAPSETRICPDTVVLTGCEWS